MKHYLKHNYIGIILFVAGFTMMQGDAFAEIFRSVSPSGHVVFSDNPVPGYQQEIIQESRTKPVIGDIDGKKSKWISPNIKQKRMTQVGNLDELTDMFDDTILDNWLSRSWQCHNHFERVDLTHNNVLNFFSGSNAPIVIPIVEKKDKSLKLLYSKAIDFQLDVKHKVLLRKYKNEEPKVLYICDKQDVPLKYREQYETYWINQEFLSGHAVGSNLVIKDGAKFLEQECRRAYQAKEYQLARSTCGLAASNEKNVISKYYLGTLYRYPWGGEIDLASSFKYTLEAANSGFSPAFGWAGWHYKFGKSVKRDYQKALMWYIADVDAGDPKSSISVADFYLQGKGVAIDYEKAAVWLLIAANNGDSHAQNKMGCMFANGVGVKQDYKLAYEWILKSSQKNNPKAIYNLALLYDEGKVIKDGKGYATQLYKKAARYGIQKSSDIIDKLDRVWID